MRKVWVTFQRKGMHRFPAAATNPQYENVRYLSLEHRHLFKFRVIIQVHHDDREIEFHQFLNWLESLYEGELSSDHRSCEMIADELYVHIHAKYPGRYVRIEVGEDGECGAEIDYP